MGRDLNTAQDYLDYTLQNKWIDMEDIPVQLQAFVQGMIQALDLGSEEPYTEPYLKLAATYGKRLIQAIREYHANDSIAKARTLEEKAWTEAEMMILSLKALQIVLIG